MLKDSLLLTIPPDTLSYKIQMINDQYTQTDHVVGTGLVALWVLGLLYTIFVFKR